MLKNFFQFIFSLKFTVICLLMLGVLTFWGTLYQVEWGLHAAKSRFFDSWLFWVGPIPIPGAQGVMAALIVNLIGGQTILFFIKRLTLGLALIHTGLIVLLVGGAVIHIFAREGSMMLLENHSSNLASHFREWEISLWEPTPSLRTVTAIDTTHFNPQTTIPFEPEQFALTVSEYYPNCIAVRKEGTTDDIESFTALSLDSNTEKNRPGIRFFLTGIDGVPQEILLYADRRNSTSLELNGKSWEVALRRKRFQLPFSIGLIDFKKELHPRTEIARTFSSRVHAKNENLDREVLISMNQPFRYKGYTLYQSKYQEFGQGVEASIFAVVHNPFRVAPYFGTGITVAGLLLHFLSMLFRFAKEQRTGEALS